MNPFAALSERIRKNPDDLEAWQSLQAQVDDVRKKQDCQAQIERIRAKRQSPVICPQCGGGMEIYFAGELRDKRARCPFCKTEIDIPDAYSKMVVEQESGFGKVLPGAQFTVYERRADNPGGKITSDEIDQLMMEKGLTAARKELEARGIQNIKLENFAGLENHPEDKKIIEEQGLKALEKTHNVIVLGNKELNLYIKVFLIAVVVINILFLLISLFQNFR